MVDNWKVINNFCLTLKGFVIKYMINVTYNQKRWRLWVLMTKKDFKFDGFLFLVHYDLASHIMEILSVFIKTNKKYKNLIYH